MNGHIEAVRLLLANGADCTAKDNEAIKTASSRGHLELVKLFIIECGVDYAPWLKCLKKNSTNIFK